MKIDSSTMCQAKQEVERQEGRLAEPECINPSLECENLRGKIQIVDG